MIFRVADFTVIKNLFTAKLIAIWDVIRAKDFYCISFNKNYRFINTDCLTKMQSACLTNFFIASYSKNCNDNLKNAVAEHNLNYAKDFINKLNKEAAEASDKAGLKWKP